MMAARPSSTTRPSVRGSVAHSSIAHSRPSVGLRDKRCTANVPPSRESIVLKGHRERLPAMEKPQIVTKTGGGHQIMKRDGKTFWVSDDDYDYYKEAFNLFDRDKSGAIDLDELGAVMSSLGFQPSAAELMAMIDKVDADQTGTVEFDEFLQMSHEWMIQGRLETEDQIREAFETIDLDGKGFITVETLERLLQMLFPNEQKSPDEIKDMIREFDTDGDGVVGFADFRGIMTET
ncbi:hypothetical protein DFJ77DRAFT_446680 [Powellomyces hirtus]|nr:hypothetical protein DFJ77DRAFT_446680 [Powellomyces hirtus]